MADKTTFLKYLDYFIYGFIVLFLLSISNSIFVNQLGYYGALVLILIRFAVSGENPFHKSGLEIAFIWFITAEILSTIFSNEQAHAFNNLLKRILLLPIVYVMIASAKDLKTAKTFFKIYIAGTMVSVIIYLYFSYGYIINNLYGITQSGPSVFQYPITASEIISFTVIFLFAFFINEKTSLRNKIFLFIGFVLSAAALILTFKRTGWMGAAFGILIILVMKKQWKVIGLGVLLVLIFLFTQRNISEVYSYTIDSGTIKESGKFEAANNAYDVYPYSDYNIVSEYGNGLGVYENGSLIKRIDLPSAVVKFSHWKDNYYVAQLIDTRFVLLDVDGMNFRQVLDFYSPGFTWSYDIFDDSFYVLDVDSGLTVFKNPDSLRVTYRSPEFASNKSVQIDSNFIAFASYEKGFSIYKMENGLPSREVIVKDTNKISFFYFDFPFVFTGNERGLNVLKIDSLQTNSIAVLPEISNPLKVVHKDSIYFIATLDEKIYIVVNSNGRFSIISNLNTGYVPNSMVIDRNNLFTTHFEDKRSRLLSVFDPYNQSNVIRLALWRVGIKIFFDNPLFGVGDIDLAKIYTEYKRPYQKEIQGHLHNNFFHVLATLGLFGFLAVCFIFYKIIAVEIKIYNKSKNVPFISSYALGAFAAFCGFLASGLTELNFWDHEITTLIWFTFGLNVAFYYSFKKSTDSKVEK